MNVENFNENPRKFVSAVKMPIYEEISSSLIKGYEQYKISKDLESNTYYKKLLEWRQSLISHAPLNDCSDEELKLLCRKRFQMFTYLADNFSNKYPITLVKSNMVSRGGPWRYEGIEFTSLDGHHRLSVACYLDIPEIPFKVVNLYKHRTIPDKDDIPLVSEYMQRSSFRLSEYMNVVLPLLRDSNFQRVVVVGDDSPVGGILLAMNLPHLNFVLCGDDQFIKVGLVIRKAIGAYVDNILLVKFSSEKTFGSGTCVVQFGDKFKNVKNAIYKGMD